ncbi:MAG: sigma 54-interacting transcriptional regulator [Syntrophales bacterium]|jgi:transcriptional regulator with GAF, ATPase, and Fis domain
MKTPLLDKDKLLESIFRISTFHFTPSNLPGVLTKILDEVVDTTGFDQGIIRLFDETRQYLEAKAVKNYSPEDEQTAFAVALNIHAHDCFSVNVAKSGRLITIEDASTDPMITETDRMLTKIYQHGTVICAPLKIEDEVIGIIAAWSEEQKKIFPEEKNLFLTFARFIGMMIYNARLFEADAEIIRQLLILQEAVSDLHMRYILDDRIRDILFESAIKIANADKALVYFWDIEKDRCLVNDGESVLIDGKQACDEKIGPSIIRKAIDFNEVIIKYENTPLDDTKPAFAGFPSEVAIPLHIKNKFKGALYLAKKTGTYTQDQLNVLDILVKNAAISYDNAIMHSLLSREAESLKSEVEKLKEQENALLGFQDIIGTSNKMTGLFQVIKDVAGHNTNILIQGESGTGKELFARAIHRQSNRIAKPFVDVNCAAIPGTLLESELFGYEAGAFTDARKRKIGLIEYANGGTMLLDEIGDMATQLQAKFLRMLEDGYIRRLGGMENIPVDVRFIFSTNKDLSRMVSEGSFREDLYYRISVVPIVIPPLRERPEDIILLIRYYVEEFNKKFKKKVKGFDNKAETILKGYSWPGNVRELRNIIERVMILSDVGTIITPDHLPAEIKIKANQKGMAQQVDIEQLVPMVPLEGLDYSQFLDRMMHRIKEKILDEAIRISGGNMTKTARLLGISRYKLIRERKKITGSFK